MFCFAWGRREAKVVQRFGLELQAKDPPKASVFDETRLSTIVLQNRPYLDPKKVQFAVFLVSLLPENGGLRSVRWTVGIWKWRLLIFQLIYIPTLSCGCEVEVATERNARTNVLHRMAGLSLRDAVRNPDIQRTSALIRASRGGLGI